MIIGETRTYLDADTAEDDQRADVAARLALARRAEALGAELTPDDVKVTDDGRARHYSAEIHPVPHAGLEAAGRVYYARMERHERTRARAEGKIFRWTPWTQLDRFHRAVMIREAQAIVEAAYPATRAAWLRDAAEEIEDGPEAGNVCYDLPLAWQQDAHLLERNA